MQNWLNHFTYRIALSAGFFLFAGFGILTISLATISYEIVRAINANPATTLNAE